ncbi:MULTISPECIES: cupin domain-containing protein [unclassified Streptomyces]|uniref:cupin domain-containing protein n=1 Tax=unclassified Streptomyces TaxID=2593676 RepID=UPI0030D207B4
MPVVRSSEAVVHEIHGGRFLSYASPRSGSKELCAWRVEIPAGHQAPVHTVDREEIFLLLSGELLVTLGGSTERVSSGDTVIVTPGVAFGIENPAQETALAWVTTSVGLRAELADGSSLTPPWAN